MGVEQWFAVPLFFIILRESLEISMIVCSLLAILKKQDAMDQRVKDMLRLKVVIGSIVGGIVSLIIGGVFLALFYTVGVDLWAKGEALWEGIFSIIGGILVTATCFYMLKGIGDFDKYTKKTEKMIQEHEEKIDSDSADIEMDIDYLFENTSTMALIFKTQPFEKALPSMLWLPFITVLREGLEACIFVGGVALSAPATSVPIPVFTGIVVGSIIGYVVYICGGKADLSLFYIFMAWILFLMANALINRSIGLFMDYAWGLAINLEADDVGAGLFDPRFAVWHFECCNPEDPANGGAMIANSLLGWRNNASWFTLIFYALYWIMVSIVVAIVLPKMKK